MGTDPAMPSDEELIARLQGGDDTALAELMLRWEIPVKRIIFRLVGNAAEADDLSQEVFVRVYTKRHTYRPGAKFSSWILTIAANQAKNRLRWWKRRPVLSLNKWIEDVGDIEDPASKPAAPAESCDRGEQIALVQSAIARLPLDQRTAITLFEYEEKSMAEIAEIVGSSPKAVENRLYRARQRLRELLSIPGSGESGEA